jgi:molybdopterin-containing oxidoreductase family iron-sulfur binding subunit
MKRKAIDPELLRDRLSVAQGKQYWRSIEELTDDPSVADMLQREFPDHADDWTDRPSRRRFLMLMGASFALAGAVGCRPPTGVIMPYVRQPENLILGKPLYYATAMTISGFGTGLLVESHEGRPTKIEGNPSHPASLGATSVFHQAATLSMYDPDRSQTIQFRANPSNWTDLLDQLRNRLKPNRGKGFAILSEAVGSPTLLEQKAEFLKAWPEAKWYTYEPVNQDNARDGAKLAFGKPLHSYLNLTDADIIVTLDADILGHGPQQISNANQFAARRKNVSHEKPNMNRLYVVESDFSITGSRADHRLPLRPSLIQTYARALAKAVDPSLACGSDESKLIPPQWIKEVAEDLKKHKGRCVVVAGDGQPPAVHALAYAMNEKLGNIGKTVLLTEINDAMKDNSLASITELKNAIEKDEVSTLIVLSGNPAYTTPSDLGFAKLLETKLKDKPIKEWLSVHLGTHFDETSRACHWHVTQTHFLEKWSDAFAFDGTVSIVQPLIAPLYASRSMHELLGGLTGAAAMDGSYTWDERAPYAIVQDYWKKKLPQGVKDFETWWKESIHDGVCKGTKWATITAPLDAALVKKLQDLKITEPKEYDLTIAPDYAVYDGRYSNNGWLQEWPKPITKLSWDNALIVSPATAAKLKVGNRVGTMKGGEHGDMYADRVIIKIGQRQIDVPVWIVPGHADDAVTLHMGYGRSFAGKVGNNTGFNANALRETRPEWFVTGALITKSRAKPFNLACQQGHHSVEGRDIVRSGTLAEYKKDSHFATQNDHFFPATAEEYLKEKEGKHDHKKSEKNGAEKGEKHDGDKHHHHRKPLPTLLHNDFPYEGYKWGMAIDLSACTGCGACVIACQAENNSPVIGKDQVTRGREMHWMRIDRYFETPIPQGEKKSYVAIHSDEVQVHFQPMLCQHCENAPCEIVCPVAATVHSDEGTNDMAYNRCVGTRYCANNCPYKVRRFNFLAYTDYATPQLRMLYNPDVTVRTRGVMEKCTFCIQRISYAHIEAGKEYLAELDYEAATKKSKPEKESRKDPNGRKVKGRELAYIRDGEVVTACQSACPATAIAFGDLNDKKSEVYKLHNSDLRYDVLGELGTRPRVAYLAELRNPNPAMASDVSKEKK